MNERIKIIADENIKICAFTKLKKALSKTNKAPQKKIGK